VETAKLEAQLAEAQRAHAVAVADQEKARAAAFEHQAQTLAVSWLSGLPCPGAWTATGACSTWRIVSCHSATLRSVVPHLR